MMLNSEISVASVSIFFSGINSVFSSIITYAIVILLEKKFSFSTNFVLIEFDNLNHPILKNLRQKLRGHFIIVLQWAHLQMMPPMQLMPIQL